jgi:hypothetical protein
LARRVADEGLELGLPLDWRPRVRFTVIEQMILRAVEVVLRGPFLCSEASDAGETERINPAGLEELKQRMTDHDRCL